MAEAPLAGVAGRVARVPQNLAQRRHIRPKRSPRLARIEPRGQGRARGHANRAIVKLRKAKPLGRQPIQVGRRNFTAVAADV